MIVILKSCYNQHHKLVSHVHSFYHTVKRWKLR